MFGSVGGGDCLIIAVVVVSGNSGHSWQGLVSVERGREKREERIEKEEKEVRVWLMVERYMAPYPINLKFSSIDWSLLGLVLLSVK